MKKILVLGLGKVGLCVATLLRDSDFDVTALDQQAPTFLPDGIDLELGGTDDKAIIERLFKTHDAVISCLPYHCNKNVAALAHQHALHYFDLSEDVPTSQLIAGFSQGKNNTVLAPQCGLAPGFVAIIGAHLAHKFVHLRSIELRVGALPSHPTGELGYAFNWSPAGVVNEYLNDCEVVQHGQVKMVPAMQDLETLVIEGNSFEAFNTSGGLGSMCQHYADRVDTLNYKTIRYPGHMRLMRFYFHELGMAKDRDHAGEILVEAKPPVNEDVVYIHAAVEGWKDDAKQRIYREEFVRSYYPQNISGHDWRAITWTTASSAVAVIEMVRNGALPKGGFIHQDHIAFDDFVKTQNGARLY